jgi:CheY-like chemotaxis protein
VARILVADDERDIRDVISLVLERAGHEVVAVGDGVIAVETHTREEFDLIISDLSMPGLDGVQVTEMVRAGERSHIPILLLTASASGRDLAQARAAGVTAHMSKPFRVAELRDLVTDLLGRANSLDVVT